MSLLVDTNVLFELRKGTSANSRVRAWFSGVSAEEICLGVLVVGELRRGIERVRSKNPSQAIALERWLRRITTDHAERILPVDGPVAEVWGPAHRQAARLGDRHAHGGHRVGSRAGARHAQRQGRSLDRRVLPQSVPNRGCVRLTAPS